MINFIKSKEKTSIIGELQKRFGITNLPFLLLRGGKEKIRAFSGSLSKEEIEKLSEVIRIELIGSYLLKNEHENEYRLSFDSCHTLKDQIIENIIELDEEQFQLWIRGHDLDIKKERGTYVISYNGDFLGCGKSNGEKLFNYVPKDRRLRK
jgi:NOL1/NOP2/fmu family ribosome biogenesis protein